MLKSNVRGFEEWNEPGNIIRKEIPGFECEMSGQDHAYLCGLLKRKQPKNILEIGVAEGGTTLVIDKAMELLGIKAKVYSVDISPVLYCDKTRPTGWVFQHCRHNAYSDQQFIFGHTIAGVIEEIVEPIDFVIIDTTHTFPGELLDFLAVLPYLPIGSTVVLHDVSLNLNRGMESNPNYIMHAASDVATKTLYLSVSANKYTVSKRGKLHNIAAFDVTEMTRQNIYGVFFALTNTWRFMPNDIQLGEYRDIFKRQYDDECNEMKCSNYR